jgi:hypothetical protein
MAESLSSQPVDAPTDADAVARKQFDVNRRGFDQNQVRSYLYSVASTIRSGDRREAELRERVAAAVRRAHEAEKLDDNALTERLGEETVRVLTTAREAAESKVAQASEEANGILEGARLEATEIREQADSVLEERSAEAEAAAESIHEDARAELIKAKELAAVEIDAGKEAAAALIEEAQGVREEVLRDMSRRRQQAKAQVERLRAGRDRILGTFDTVQEALDDVRSGVKQSLGEAKVAADSAARRILDERLPGIDELEAEVETTRMLDMASAPAADSVDVEVFEPAEAVEPDVAEPSEADAEEATAEIDMDAEFESRKVELDPEIRAGKKLKDQPDVVGDVLTTVVIGDPDVEEVQIKVDSDLADAEPPAEEEAETALEDAAESEVEDAAASEESSSPEEIVEDLFERLRTERSESSEAAANATAAAATADIIDEPAPQPDAEPGADDEPEAEPEEVGDPVTVALVATAERRLKRVLADDQNRVLSGLRPKGRGKRRGDPPDQLDLETQVELYVEAISAQIEARAEAGGTTDIAAARVSLSDGFVAPLRDAVEVAVSSVEDPDDKVSAVRAVYRECKGRMGEIAAELIG